MQFTLPGLTLKKTHGGEFSVGKRKTARPIATRKAMHLTLRSSQAKGKNSLHTKKKEIEKVVSGFANLFEVRLYSFSNNGNHLHFLLQARTRGGFKRFLMAVTGRIAQVMTKARRGVALPGRYWDLPPFTRIVAWGKDFIATWRYVKLNQIEAAGVIPYQPRVKSPRPPHTKRHRKLSVG